MPNKTIYVSKADEPIWEKAKAELAGSLSSFIIQAFKERLSPQKVTGQNFNELVMADGCLRKFTEDGIFFMWTGFKECQRDTTLGGQWVAMREGTKERMVYACAGNPPVVGALNRGDSFTLPVNLPSRSDWDFSEKNIIELRNYRDEALKALRRFIADNPESF